MRQIYRTLHCVVALILTLALLVANLRLYSSYGARYRGARIAHDVLLQLRFLGMALRDGAGERMQQLFPEGFFFTHVLYGLAWVEYALDQPRDTPLYHEALAEARWALQRLDSPAARAPFVTMRDPQFGVFYVGWSNWLRGGILKLQPDEERDGTMIARFAAECEALAAAFEASSTPFLPAYPRQAWPVDSVVAVATLRLHDALIPARFTATVAGWLRSARARLDPATGLLPHRVDVVTGHMLEGARGSSQSVIEHFLIEIDPAWAREQYTQFRHQFVTTVWGIPGVREYPIGKAGAGDVDSGPLVFGLSASASVVTLGAALLHGDRALADPFLDIIETIGIPMSWSGTKRYAFGRLPVGDAFLVWAKTARPWIAQPAPAVLPPVTRPWWRLPLHGLTLAVVALLWFPMRRKYRNPTSNE